MGTLCAHLPRCGLFGSWCCGDRAQQGATPRSAFQITARHNWHGHIWLNLRPGPRRVRTILGSCSCWRRRQWQGHIQISQVRTGLVVVWAALTKSRISGYIVLFAALATVATATQTDFNKNLLGMRLWAILLTIVLVLIGVIPRVKPSKLGF